MVTKINREIESLVGIMTSKPMSDKHLTYIYNRVIVPRIEYWTQNYVLTESTLNSLATKYRTMAKHKLRMTKTMPNVILENPYIYNHTNLIENQIQAKISNFFVQLNDRNLLGKITKFV